MSDQAEQPIQARVVAVDGESVHRVATDLAAAGVELVDRGSTGIPWVVAAPTLTDQTAELVKQLASSARVFLTATRSLAPSDAWRAVSAGAADAIKWEGRDTAAAIAARLGRWRAVDALADSPLVRRNLVGSSACWQAATRELVEVALTPDMPVLLLGESGTGKELAARLVHEIDPRPDKRDLVIVDCSTIVRDLSGSEFFGHERGAFTGAVSAREGAFGLADGGSLFLDEVGELPLDLQPELLRVVQEGTYKRVGSDRWRKTRFRLICATNRDLDAERRGGRFRTDLYFRLAGAVISLPPLRDRGRDVVELARTFLSDGRGGSPELDAAVVEYLQAREYPGNVRDLRQLAARVRMRHVGPGPVTVGDIPDTERPPVSQECARPAGRLRDAVATEVTAGRELREIVEAAREAAIDAALEQSDGRVTDAARRLGVTQRAIQLHRASRRRKADGVAAGTELAAHESEMREPLS